LFGSALPSPEGGDESPDFACDADVELDAGCALPRGSVC